MVKSDFPNTPSPKVLPLRSPLRSGGHPFKAGGVPYKQIIIAMGEGAKEGFSAFEDFARGHIEPLA